MWIKICATTNLDDALQAARSGADALGFVFAPSKRRVTPEQVAAITPHLPPSIERIGIFTITNAAEILAAAKLANLTGIQLNTPLDPHLIDQLKSAALKVLQVVPFGIEGGPAAEARFEQDLRAALATPGIDAILLDTAKSGAAGGTGHAFPWAAAATILQRVWPEATPIRLILAGGLRPENVEEAIATLHPDGVDVVSGVEASFGRKDPRRVEDFVAKSRLRATS